MRISARTFEGKTITLEVQASDTIQHAKKQIQNQERIRTDLQRLMFANQQLENNRSLSSYGIVEGSILHLVLLNPYIPLLTGSAEYSKTVAGGYGLGSTTNEFCFPYGLAIDEDQTMFIADWGNHRIIQWKMGELEGQVIAGGHGQGKELNQLNCPTDVLIDKETDSLIISDHGNKRVIRWLLREGTTQGEILIDNIACWGLAMGDRRCLYISDIEKDEVRRYEMGENNGTVVAGGHGRGVGRNQLNKPTYIFVDSQQTVYVSDTSNHRVMKWEKEATQGVVVAQGFSRGLFVDKSETVYVADYGNHQLMRWPKGATEGTVIVGGNEKGEEGSELYYPWTLSFDQQGQIYVADHSYHRIQRFPLQANSS